MKRIIRFALVLSAAVALLVGAALWLAGRAGSSAVESWVAAQIQVVADAYLHPRLTFVDLDYEFPSTIRLKSLRLTADDPANPGKTIDIVSCEQATVELTEMPRKGEPIHIASIVLRRPTFRAVAAGDGSKRLIGFSQLIRRATPELAMQPTPPGRGAQAAAPGTPGSSGQPSPADVPRLSEFLRMKRVELIDGQIISDARLPGVPRMQIDKINTALAVESQSGGWYVLDSHITRAPIFELAITGRLNLDRFEAADAVVSVKGQIAREHDSYLPPDLQKFLRDHEVQGTLQANITAASLPLLDLARGQMRVEATLQNANVSYRDYRLPIDLLRLSAALDTGVLTLSKLDVSALRGEAQVRGVLALNESLDADLRAVVRDMILDHTIRDGTAAATRPSYGGRVNGQFAAAAPLRSLATTRPTGRTWGRGTITIDQGQLVHIPVVQGLGRAITRGTSWITGRSRGKGQGTDRANVTFTLAGHEAHCSEIRYVGDVFAARGRGIVRFDQELDLIVNGGPLEKMQHLMGKHVGGVFGRLTDAIAGYRVTGTVAEPDIDVQLAGGRVNKVGRSVKNGIGRVVDGVSSAGSGASED